MKNQVAQIDLRQNAWECVLIRFIGEIEMELTFTARMRMIRFRLIRFREEIEIELTFTARENDYKQVDQILRRNINRTHIHCTHENV